MLGYVSVEGENQQSQSLLIAISRQKMMNLSFKTRSLGW
jgi:hypothetical protein